MDEELLRLLKHFRDRLMLVYYASGAGMDDGLRRRLESILDSIDSILVREGRAI